MKLTKIHYWLIGLGAALVLLIIFSLSLATVQTSTKYSQGEDFVLSMPAPMMDYDEAAGSMEVMEERAVTTSSTNAYDVDDGTIETESYVIKTGYLSLTVAKIDDAVNQLQSIAGALGGNVLNQSINTYNDEKYGYVTLRVDDENFDTAMEQIKAIASAVTSEDISSDDVTEQVIDLEARLKNAQAEEESYLAVLNRATTVEDILKVQSYLSQVREEIERYEAQLEYYSTRTSYSTITINLAEETSVTFETESFRPLEALRDAIQTVIILAQQLLVSLIYLVIVGGAILLPLVIVGLIVKWLVRKLKK